jgi:holo-[acyl-carrier protein] synthase
LGADGKSFNLTDIEVLSGDNGQPLLKLHGLAKTRAASLKLNGLSLSLSHSRSYAIALAVGQSVE